METIALKPSDMKTCSCSHAAHRHPTKVAKASKWRDKCMDCACRRFRVASNKQENGAWVPDAKPVRKVEESGPSWRTPEFEAFLNKKIEPVYQKEPEEPIVIRRIWPD
jgi:hypothetical protein